MAEYEDLPYIVIERRSGGAAPFLWGALLGAGVALLLAPRSGEETQEEIRQSARRLRMAAEDRVNGVRDTVTGSINRTRNQFQDRIDTVRTDFESRAEQARQVLDAGRRAAHDARSELERRVQEAKQSVQTASDAMRGSTSPGGAAPPSPPTGDVVVTDVVVEEAEGRPDLG